MLADEELDARLTPEEAPAVEPVPAEPPPEVPGAGV
jgi:hypothetical protein